MLRKNRTGREPNFLHHMTARVPFFKYSATGNDFILLDNREQKFHGNEVALFESLCARKTGVGADGILLIENPRRTECAFTMRYFNRDGRESEMCGNGARASAYHAATTQLAPAEMRFEVSGDIYEASVAGEQVSLRMQTPRDLRLKPGVISAIEKSNTPRAPLEGGILKMEEIKLEEGGFVNTGVPHYVLFAANIDQLNVTAMGRELRHHPAFAPAGTNVNFVEVLAGSQVKLRTYERGVEEETLACGTGATAAALIAHLQHGLAFPIHLQACGGELVVRRDPKTERLVLQGQVKRVFIGEFELCN